MQVQDTSLPDAKLVVPRVFPDDRGFFAETFRESALAEHGIHDHWIQDNHSRSARGVVRGLHFQIGDGCAKLVRCGRGQCGQSCRRLEQLGSIWNNHLLLLLLLLLLSLLLLLVLVLILAFG